MGDEKPFAVKADLGIAEVVRAVGGTLARQRFAMGWA